PVSGKSRAATESPWARQWGRALEHVPQGPVVAPSGIDLVIDVLIADIRRQSDPVRGALVRGRGVDHVRAVQHDIAGLVVGDQPARIEALCHVGQVLRYPAAL